jgi:hypothetical protein
LLHRSDPVNSQYETEICMHLGGACPLLKTS